MTTLRARSAGVVVLGAVFGAFVAGISPASAELLGVTKGPPDITSGYINVDYVASTGAFSAQGNAVAFDLDGAAPPDYNISGGTFALNMKLTSAGVPVNGSVSIGGTTVPALASGTLLTGSIARFGFPDTAGGKSFDFIFNKTGGSLASYYGDQFAMILGDTGVSFPGNFTSNFQSTAYSGTSDTVPIPEPSTLSMLLWLATAGVAGIATHRRRCALRD
jgi:hypothetical protein